MRHPSMARPPTTAAAAVLLAFAWSAPLDAQHQPADPPTAAAPGPQAGTARARAARHDDASLEWAPCPGFLPEGCAIAILNGDPAGPNADLFFKVPGGAEIPAHWHTSAERIVLVSGELEVRYADTAPKTLRPGSYAYGPAGAVHEGSCATGDDCVLFIAFEQPVDAVPVDAGDP